MKFFLKLTYQEIQKTRKAKVVFFVYLLTFLFFSLSYEYFFMNAYEFEKSLARVPGKNPYQLIRGPHVAVYSILLPLVITFLFYHINSLELTNNIRKVRELLPYPLWKWKLMKILNCIFWLFSILLLMILLDFVYVKYFENFKDWNLTSYENPFGVYLLFLFKSSFYVVVHLFILDILHNRYPIPIFVYILIYLVLLPFWSPFIELELFPDVFDKINYVDYFFKSNYSVWINSVLIFLFVLYTRYTK